MATKQAPARNPKSAKPGTQDKTPKAKKKVERVTHPALLDADNNPVKVEAVPDDFDPKKHKPLKRADFKDEALWFDMRADDYERRAKDYRQQAEDCRKLGSVSDRQAAKKLLAMQRRIAELQEKLKGEGVDVAALLARAEESE